MANVTEHIVYTEVTENSSHSMYLEKGRQALWRIKHCLILDGEGNIKIIEGGKNICLGW